MKSNGSHSKQPHFHISVCLRFLIFILSVFLPRSTHNGDPALHGSPCLCCKGCLFPSRLGQRAPGTRAGRGNAPRSSTDSGLPMICAVLDSVSFSHLLTHVGNCFNGTEEFPGEKIIVEEQGGSGEQCGDKEPLCGWCWPLLNAIGTAGLWADLTTCFRSTNLVFGYLAKGEILLFP